MRLYLSRYCLRTIPHHGTHEPRHRLVETRLPKRALRGQQTLKGSRFLLFQNYDSFAPERKTWLDALLQENSPLFVIHSMKEPLSVRLFWQEGGSKEVEPFHAVWCRNAMHSEIKLHERVGKTLSGPTGLDFSTTSISTLCEGDR